MTRLQDLFATARRRDERVIRALDNPAASRRLEAIFDGAPRATSTRAHVPDEVAALTGLIESRRVEPAEPRGARKQPRLRRSRSGRDWLSIGAAMVAVISVAGASTLVGISIASASPASEALKALAADEAELANTIERVNGSISVLEQTQQSAKNDAEALGGPLGALGEIAQIPGIAAVESARQALLSSIDAVKMPSTLAAYRRPAIDADTLESVGTAIDFVDSRSREARDASDALDEIRLSLEKTTRPLADAISALGSQLPAVATTLVEENDLADETLRTNVTMLAERLAQGETRAAPGAISDFVSAVDALRAGQTTVEDELAAEAAAEARRREQEREAAEQETTPTQPAEPAPIVEPAPEPQPEPEPEPEPTPTQTELPLPAPSSSP